MSELLSGIINGDLEQVRDIIENKIMGVNQLISGKIPLHYAVDYGQIEVVRYLLENGANANAMDVHGTTILLAAIQKGDTNCVKLLLEKGANSDDIIYMDAAEKEEIKQLLKPH